MKRFLKTFFAFAAVIAAVVLLINVACLLREQENWGTMNYFRGDNAIIKDVPEKIQICNFGSSYGLYGFNYEMLSKDFTCFNFGLPMQFPSYDYRLLQNYKNNIAEGAVVFLPIAYFSFFGESETKSSDFASKNKRYYRFLESEYIKEYDPSTQLWIKYLPALSYGSFGSVAEKLCSGDNASDVWNNVINKSEATDHGAMRYRNHIESRKDEGGGRVFNQEEIDSVYSFIELCKENEFTPVLLVTPLLNEYSLQIRNNDPAFYDDFYGVIEQIVYDTGVQYYDYSSDERIINDYSLFLDTDHLNRDGAQEFVAILKRDILDELLLNL